MEGTESNIGFSKQQICIDNDLLEECGIENYTYNDANHFEFSNVDIIDSGEYQIKSANLMGDAPKALISIDGCKYLTKTGHKWYPIESITEHLLNQLGIVFGLEMADSRIAIINNQLRFLSKWFLSEDESLVHGAEIFSNYLNDTDFVTEVEKQKMSRVLFTLQFVEKAVKLYSPTNYNIILHKLVKLLLYDALVGNNDRHFENWAVIVKNVGSSEPEFSPVYDTARGLFWNQSEESLQTFTDDKIKKYSVNSKPKLGWDGVNDKNLNHFRLVKEIYQNQFYITQEEMKQLFEQQMIDAMKKYVVNNYTSLMSSRRIEVICKCLDFRYQTIKNILI
ncbi:MAG: HipA domain-containing protein [Bacteroidales bacterium]|nr:HipA domain-containing protein [Bacteroidales bacterium]